MFVICRSTTRYCNRDGYAGEEITRLGGYAYETAALARRMLPSCFDENGDMVDEDTYFVADASDPYLKPIPRPACPVLDDLDDIDF